MSPQSHVEIVASGAKRIDVQLAVPETSSTISSIVVLCNDVVVASVPSLDNAEDSGKVKISIHTEDLQKLDGDTLVFIAFSDRVHKLHECHVNELLYPDALAVLKSKPLLELAPSYGFFGGIRRESMALEVNQVVDEIVLQVENEKGYLNFSALSLLDAAGSPIAPAKTITVTASSSKLDNDKLQKVIANGGFHSNLEANPWLKISFSKPTYISTLQLRNRGDQWGSRLQGLRIDVSYKKDCHSLLAPYQSETKDEFYNALAPYVNVDDSNMSVDELRANLLKTFIEERRNNLEKLATADFTLSLQLLSTWAAKKSAEPIHSLELKILALFVCMHTRKTFNITLAPFCRLLPHADDLDKLEQLVNQYREAAFSLTPLKFTKHGAARRGMLTQNIPDVVKALRTVMDDLTDMGYEPCLAYGTLLGACRDNAFISHDDDVDILIKLTDSPIDKERAFELRDELMEAIDRDKYRVAIGSKTVRNLNMHIFHKETNIMIDVFPYWIQDGKANLHMENMKIRGISPAIFDGRKTTILYNEEFDIPAIPEPFLEERYGEDWMVSNRFHEWPWKIQQ